MCPAGKDTMFVLDLSLKLNHYGEARMCLAHAASLVDEYLRMLKSKDYMPNGCVKLQVCPTTTTMNFCKGRRLSLSLENLDESGGRKRRER
jgi:hypothetical protein